MRCRPSSTTSTTCAPSGAPCRPTACATRRSRSTYQNGVKQTSTYSFPFEKDDADFGRDQQIGAYTLTWDVDAHSCSPDPRPIQIKHVLKPGKTAVSAFSGSCSWEANGWGVYYSVRYSDGTSSGGHVAFNTDSVAAGYGTMYVDFGNDIAVNQLWDVSGCG